MIWADELLAEELLPSALHILYLHKTRRELKSLLKVCQEARAFLLVKGEPVYDYVYVVLLVLL